MASNRTSTASTRTGIFSSTDLQFILTFAAGMGGFWLSANLPGYIPAKAMPTGTVGLALSLIIALAIYGLVRALWLTFTLGRHRARKPIIISTALVTIPALASSLILTFTDIGVAHNQTQLAILAFILYLVYGTYYVTGWATARKLTK